jgi:hypothetical protein
MASAYVRKIKYTLKIKEMKLDAKTFGDTRKQQSHTVSDIKSYIFWDIMPCNPVKASQHFAGTYCLHLLA